MKRFLTVLILISMFTALAGGLSACVHKCTFSEEWTGDETSHWHTCTRESCTEISDKGDHTWDNGTTETAATQEADGEKVYICTVCDQKKTETVEFTGLTRVQWDEAFNEDTFQNVTYTETSVVSAEGMEITTVTVCKFEKNKSYISITVAGKTESETFSRKDTKELRASMWESLEPLVKYNNFNYNRETKSYYMTWPVSIPSLDEMADSITIKMKDEKPSEIIYTCVKENNGIKFNVASTVTFTDYGKTVAQESAPAEDA